MGHPDYAKQLSDEIGDLVSDAMERDQLTALQVQNLLLQIASDLQPFEPPTVRNEVV
ncbi:MAG: hypothetical protein AAFR65_10465 [Pseudomonadota bacterium]